MMNKKFWIAAVATALSACGGGSGGNAALPAGSQVTAPPSSQVDEQKPPTQEPVVPAVRTTRYEILPTPVDLSGMVTQLKKEGQANWRLSTNMDFLVEGVTSFFQLFVKDSDQSFDYAMATETMANPTDFGQQLNQRGAQGYAFVGSYSFDGQGNPNGSLFEKRTPPGSTFNYHLPPVSENVLTQLKAQGALGYRYVGVGPGVLSAATVRIYEQDSQLATTYDYVMLPWPADDDAFFTQVNAQGAGGFRFMGLQTEGSAVSMLFEKDRSQNETFNFFGLDYQRSPDSYVVQANEQGAIGKTLFGRFLMPSGIMKTLYYSRG